SVKKKVENRDFDLELNVTNSEEILEDLSDSVNNENDINQTKKEIYLDENLVDDENLSVVKSLKIIPRTKLWVGYIDIETNKHYEKIVVKDIIDLDTTKDWLILLGHSYVDIEVNGDTKEFSGKENLRFLYQNSELKIITIDQFKALNKGKKW
ncbi:MAG: hypothetical protein JXQ66_02955, partial [Campylobacterales bacterium]|nr:hypothetical protein [Campylobacterales bacterium]